LHVDTTWKFRDMIRHCDMNRGEVRREAAVYTKPGRARARDQPDHLRLAAAHSVMKDRRAEAGLDKFGFDAAFGARSRDEEKSRAKERCSRSVRPDVWDPRNQRPSSGGSQHAHQQRRNDSVFPLSNWTELDIGSTTRASEFPWCQLYFAARGRW